MTETADQATNPRKQRLRKGPDFHRDCARRASRAPRKILHATLASWDEQSKTFDPARFFHFWFRDLGSPYFVIFRKNARVTNLQLAELLRLIRVCARDVEGRPIGSEVQFLTQPVFRRTIHALATSTSRDAAAPIEEGAAIGRSLLDSFAPVIERSIVIHPLHGSCALYVPPGIALDTDELCYSAGLIHSVGVNIYTRRTDKAVPDEFFAAVEDHLSNHPSRQRMPFIVYAHEDFTPFDRPLAGELQDGLDDLKIELDKHHMVRTPLVELINTLADRFSDRLVVPSAGDFKRGYEEVSSLTDADLSRSLWLVADRAIGPSDETATRSYYVCYEQLVVNENPFHLFDEGKPAWISPTTTPHMLVGACLSLSRPAWGASPQITIGDPFLGSGTTALEATKFAEADLRCSDSDPLSTTLLADNAAVSSASVAVLTSLIRSLQDLASSLATAAMERQMSQGGLAVSSDLYETYLHVRGQLQGSRDGSSPSVSPTDLLASLDPDTLTTRLVAYLGLRTELRNLARLVRPAAVDATSPWEEAFVDELAALLAQLQRLQRLRERESKTQYRPDDVGPRSFYMSKYSRGCTVSPTWIRDHSSVHAVRIADVEELLEGTFDIIIADPPYGFNTEIHPRTLAKLYSKMATSMVRALNDGGQLVLVLPDQSLSGRQSPYFTHKEIVERQLLSAADSIGAELVFPTQRVFGRKTFQDLANPPYYWVSGALRRAVLHCRLHRAPATV